MSQFDRWIDRLALRVRWGEFLHRAAKGLPIYLVVAGTVILACKLLVPREASRCRNSFFFSFRRTLLRRCLLQQSMP